MHNTPPKEILGDAHSYGVSFDEKRSCRKKIRLAIIGAGGIAQTKYLPAVMRLRTMWEPVEVAAISRRDRQQGEKIAKLYGCRWYADSGKMLREEELDGVLITGPDELHAEHVMMSLNANLPVLVEKPITRSLVDAEKICRYADKKQLVLMTVANKRYSPPYRRAKQFVEQGPVSNPALYCGKFNLGAGGGLLLETGTVHVFDLTRYFMGEVARVHAVAVNKYHGNKLKYPVDNVVSTFEFTSGSVGTLYTSSAAHFFKPMERVEIYGNKSWLTVEDQNELLLYDSEEGPAKSWKPVVPFPVSFFDVELGGFLGLVQNFLEVIRGNEKPLVTGWDGYRAYELVVATQLSLYRKETLKLPMDPKTADDEQEEWFKSAR